MSFKNISFKTNLEQMYSSRVVSRVVRHLHSSRSVLKDALVPVPRMGDSITEGTLIKFAVEPGSALKVDDIVCVIETDKVRISL